MRTSFDRNRLAGDHSLYALALGPVSFAQPLSISCAGKALTPAAVSTKSARRRRPRKALGGSTLGMYLCPRLISTDSDCRFESSHFISLQS
jgi:hypothetical protein